MRPGVTLRDMSFLRILIRSGESAEYISKKLNVELKCIESFVEKFGPEPKVKPKRKYTRRKKIAKPDRTTSDCRGEAQGGEP